MIKSQVSAVLLMQTIGKTDYVRRYPLARENYLFPDTVWVCPYQLRTSRVVHRVLYEIVEDDQDGTFVLILHIRHGARKPMTRAEARKIEDDA